MIHVGYSRPSNHRPRGLRSGRPPELTKLGGNRTTGSKHRAVPVAILGPTRSGGINKQYPWNVFDTIRHMRNTTVGSLRFRCLEVLWSTEKRPAAFSHLIPIHHEGRREFDIPKDKQEVSAFGHAAAPGLRGPGLQKTAGGGALQSAIPQAAQGPSAQSQAEPRTSTTRRRDIRQLRQESTAGAQASRTSDSLRLCRPMDVSNTTSREGQWIHKATPQSSLNWARASKGAIRNFGNEEFDFVIVAMPYEKSWHSFKTPTTGKRTFSAAVKPPRLSLPWLR